MQGLYSNPVQFYDFLQNRVMIVFRPKHEEPSQEYPEFHLILNKKQNYDSVSQECHVCIAVFILLPDGK